MKLSELAWPVVAALSKDTPVVFPVAALEQHGHHLPVFTDSLLCGEIVRRAEERLGDRVLFAPMTWLGNSDHHLDFAGTGARVVDRHGVGRGAALDRPVGNIELAAVPGAGDGMAVQLTFP